MVSGKKNSNNMNKAENTTSRKCTHRTKDSMVRYICYCSKIPPGKPQVLQVKGRVARKSSKSTPVSIIQKHPIRKF